MEILALSARETGQLALARRAAPTKSHCATLGTAAIGDDDIGVTLPGLAIASALHETQYTRLFRS